MAKNDIRTEQNTLDFWKVPSVIAKYIPDILRVPDNMSDMKPMNQNTIEKELLAHKQLNEINGVFSKAFSDIGIDYENLSIKEKYYLMQDEQISNIVENTFINILHKTNRLDLLSGITLEIISKSNSDRS